MKTIKYVLSLALIFFLGCSDDDTDLSFVNNIEAPTNVGAQFLLSQDNTGLVTITPNSEGGVSYSITLGDDTVEPVTVAQGENIEHTYAEGTYAIGVEATGITGLKTSTSQELVVSFRAPENLVVTIENDAAISKQVNVTATADFAMTFEVDFGDGSDLLPANIGETVSHIYDDAGLYTINVTAMGGAIETTTYTEVDFEVTAILAPLGPAPSPFNAEDDVISIFSDVYTDIAGTDFFPNWGQSTIYTPFDLNGDAMIQYSNLNYEGIQLGATIDASGMEFLHLDIWTADDNDAKISPISIGSGEQAYDLVLTANEWTSVDIPLTYFTDLGLDMSDIHQFKFDGVPAGGTIFVDNFYFWKAPSGPSPLVGIWKIAPEDAAVYVGPGDGSTWWYLNQWGDDVTTRACWMDDEYVFSADGTFSNVLGTETWLEAWQGVDPDACGAPIAPHDGSNPATWSSTDNTITINGLGAYLGLSKVHNTGEDGMPVNNTITYDYVLSPDGNTLEISVTGFNGGAEIWYFKMLKQ